MKAQDCALGCEWIIARRGGLGKGFLAQRAAVKVLECATMRLCIVIVVETRSRWRSANAEIMLIVAAELAKNIVSALCHQ